MSISYRSDDLIENIAFEKKTKTGYGLTNGPPIHPYDRHVFIYRCKHICTVDAISKLLAMMISKRKHNCFNTKKMITLVVFDDYSVQNLHNLSWNNISFLCNHNLFSTKSYTYCWLKSRLTSVRPIGVDHRRSCIALISPPPHLSSFSFTSLPDCFLYQFTLPLPHSVLFLL